MVLKAKKFETQDETAQVMEDKVTEATEEFEQAAPTTTAVAAPQQTAVSSGLGGAALANLEYAISLEDVRSLGSGVLPKISADRAGFEVNNNGETVMYGDWMDVRVYSFNRRWLASAGVDGEAGIEYLRTSYDGETIEDESMTLAGYVQHLKEQGYDKAGAREYVDVYGFVINSEKTGKIDEADLELIQLQLSPQSVKSFMAYRLKAGVTAKMTGKEVGDVIRATIQRREYNGNKYASISFSAA